MIIRINHCRLAENQTLFMSKFLVWKSCLVGQFEIVVILNTYRCSKVVSRLAPKICKCKSVSVRHPFIHLSLCCGSVVIRMSSRGTSEMKTEKLESRFVFPAHVHISEAMIALPKDTSQIKATPADNIKVSTCPARASCKWVTDKVLKKHSSYMKLRFYIWYLQNLATHIKTVYSRLPQQCSSVRFGMVPLFCASTSKICGRYP